MTRAATSWAIHVGQCPHNLACGPPRKDQLPNRRVPELDHLCTQLQAAARAGREIDRPHRHLRGQAQRVGGSGTVRHDGFPTLVRKALDHLEG